MGGPDRTAITGPMMAQYLMTLLGSQRPDGMRGLGGDPFAELVFDALGAHESEGGNGRWGDYVFNQEGEKCLLISQRTFCLTLCVSFGRNHDTIDGELKLWKTSTSHR